MHGLIVEHAYTLNAAATVSNTRTIYTHADNTGHLVATVNNKQ